MCDIPKEGFWEAMKILAGGLDYVAAAQLITLGFVVANMFVGVALAWTLWRASK